MQFKIFRVLVHVLCFPSCATNYLQLCILFVDYEMWYYCIINSHCDINNDLRSIWLLFTHIHPPFFFVKFFENFCHKIEWFLENLKHFNKKCTFFPIFYTWWVQVGSQMYVRIFNHFLSYFSNSQIWLNQLMDDHHIS